MNNLRHLLILNARPIRRAKFYCATVILLSPALAFGQEQQEHAMRAPNSQQAMLLEGMGDVHRTISTNSPEAQKFFDQGLALIYGFNREEAERSFRRAARLDPRAPMPLWGIALGLGPHINMDMDGDVDFKEGYETIQKALKLAADAPPHERAFIEALAKRFSPDPNADEKKLSSDYRKAMADLVKRYPDDLDAATLYAESIMCLSRWDYWNPDGSGKNGTDEFVSVLESVLRRDPSHLGANHFYIHAVEASPTPERALPSAARLMGLAPSAGHLVHMPGHIFLRTGDFAQAVFTNEHAVKADLDYIKESGTGAGVYTMGYTSHNFHFLVFGNSMAGRFTDALKSAEELAIHVQPAMATMPPMVDFFGAQPLVVLYRFNRWDEILKIAEPDSKLPMTVALWHFARTCALAGTGKLGDARNEQKAFESSVHKLPKDYMMGINSAESLCRIAAAIIDARLASDPAAAVEHWKRAVADQDLLRYDEPPAWFYPVRESLGGALLRAGRALEAEAVFREDLRLNPRNGRSLFGLMKSLEAQKKTHDLEWVRREFERAWRFAEVKLSVETL
jgi:tetratricopeptide (TPR) repeat protein